ncbi:MAG: hypothetical protein ACJAQ5_002571 [Flavobacteriales bacterium]|jgi:hypothetical protein
MVFNTTTIETGWDGNAHGQRMPSGVYVYYLQVRLNTGEVEELNGNVTLIR